MPPTYFPLRWERTGDQRCCFILTPIISLNSLPFEEFVVSKLWDDEAQFVDVAKCRSQVAQKLLLEGENKKGQNSLIRAGYGGWLLYNAASTGDVGFVEEIHILYLVKQNTGSPIFFMLRVGARILRFSGDVHAAARVGNLEILKELGDCLDISEYRDDQGCTLLNLSFKFTNQSNNANYLDLSFP
ncbi:hypothetical protein POM88_028315 [Heracleum sosnowskyi]|uniref:Uncharacterized protein n=1 Tax=Heracleum sosnowskyi TaxID=360622 RepID=A0AAD8MQC0_9APIA|nr:hypothetical protein POM88_028315 [Heracleum sosnowskyi]